MNSAFDFFSKIYCINLSHRVDRRDHMQSVFETLNIHTRVNWFDAIHTPGVGHQGCVLSHYNIIKLAMSEQLDNVLILEDDIIPTAFYNENNIRKSIETLTKQDWDILYLGGRVVRPAVDINNYLFKSSLWSTGSLCINNTIYEKCLDVINQQQTIDWFYSSPVQNFKCYSVNPCAFVQNPDLGSDIAEGPDRRDVFIESYNNRHVASPPLENWWNEKHPHWD